MDAANYGYRVVENAYIPMSDGCRLAARIWLPDEVHSQPVPAILEYIPYRKRGGSDLRDDINYPHFARHGYAGVRVDIRGNGESDGLMTGEYTEQELTDGTEVIAWIAAQDWCDGNVGMMGHSWGGFNGLQVGALNPPALKAIITSCSTDDRYADDIHFMGGCLNNDNTTWSQQMLYYSTRPPDPALVGDGWLDLWLNRLENMPFLAADWLRHQRRDAFWKHASVCEDYSAIKAPVLAVGGWYDSYTNAIPRLVAGLPGQAWGIIGPWEHRYPHMAKITPGIDFLTEAVRWWDRWLKGIDNGVDKDPALRAYMIKAAPASEKNSPREGHWVGEDSWPAPDIALTPFHLDSTGLSGEPAMDGTAQIRSPINTGLACGNFCPGMRIDDELPGDQQADDAKSIVFETAPLEHDLAILGAPVLELEIASDKPLALIAARLCDVAPDGASTRVSHNPFNLTHHASHEHPDALVPGKFYNVRFKLCDAGYIFPAGHRIRLALSSNYWPMVWPVPEDATLTIAYSGCTLHLPVRSANDGRIGLAAPKPLPDTTFEVLRAPSNTRTSGTKVGETVIEIKDDLGRMVDNSNGLITDSRARHVYSIADGDPLSGQTAADWVFETVREDWSARVETATEMTCDGTHFFLKAQVRAFSGGALVFEKQWNEEIARDLV